MVTILSVLLIASLLWGIWREFSFHRVERRSTEQLSRIVSRIGSIVSKMDESSRTEDSQQRELREMLRFMQTRIIETIHYIREPNSAHSTNIYNNQNKDESLHDTVCDIKGGQNNVGSNELKGSQNNAQ